MTTINQVAVNVQNILTENNIKFSGTYIHPITGKTVSPFGHTESQGSVDLAFLSIRQEHRLTNAVELIKFIAAQPDNMSSSKSRQKAALTRGCMLVGHDVQKAYQMAGEKITYLGNVNKHCVKTSMFWKQFSSLHGNSQAIWQCFQGIVNQFNTIRKDALSAKTGLMKQAKNVQPKVHCLTIAEVQANILTAERDVKTAVMLEKAIETLEKPVTIPTAEKVWEMVENIPTAEKVWEMVESQPVSAKTIIRRRK